MWVSYRPDQAWVALLLNIASSISCHKLAGVALARCLSRQVKNDPPTADRTAQLAGWAGQQKDEQETNGPTTKATTEDAMEDNKFLFGSHCEAKLAERSH